MAATYREVSFLHSNDEQDLHEDSEDFLDHYGDVTRCLNRVDGLDRFGEIAMDGLLF